MFQRYTCIICCLSAFFISSLTYCQCLTKEEIYKKIFSIENNVSLSDEQKLKSFYALKKTTDNCLPDKDSVYAWVFLKLGKYEFWWNKNYENAIKFTENALAINNFSAKGSSEYLNINACFNLASSYEALLLYGKAVLYYDSVIYLCRNFIDTNTFVLDARAHKANIYFLSGDYQKAVEEGIKGVHLAETENNITYKVLFLNLEAQAFLFQNDLESSLPIAYESAIFAKQINDAFELATAYKTIAFLYEKKNLIDSAKYYYSKAINNRLKTNQYSNIGADYNEFGNFYNALKDYNNAAKCYNQFLLYADKISDPVDRSIKTALAYLNFGENFFAQHKLNEAEYLYLRSMNTLNLNVSSILNNPSSEKIGILNSNAELIIGLMSNKTKLLLEQYKTSRQKKFLDACLQTALVTDTVINQIRHEHVGEQSKIYWRDKTNQFYADAIEASYLAGNSTLAFYFIEKSRAMLLSDKLNELNASSYLPVQEGRIEETYQIKIIEFEQKLSSLNTDSKQFQTLQLQLLAAKDNFEHYIKSLEQKYSAYYQYKYADEVPSLNGLQKYLKRNNQSFVHYFLDDTVTYILAITPNNTQFMQVKQAGFNKDQLAQFLQLCSNKTALNNHYGSFALLSNSIYKKIFQPLQLPKGSVIICSDAIVIPFEALCSDANGRNFLLNDYSFSYVYSARFLMKQFNNPAAKGNFIGFAPVSFAHYLKLQDLKNAAHALQASAAWYKNNKLFVNRSASRSNFFDYASSYSVMSIFSHARADTTNNEPVLFMQDSVIHLSELQLLNNPATKLVLLTACETNVGKTANGEGIYSLARGFATAGIPSVAATLWKADEQTIYAISEKFNQYLSEGMNKDEALQKAKMYFIQHNSSDKLLPYYWANMIIIGNTDAINIVTTNNSYWLWITGCIVLILAVLIIVRMKFYKRKNDN